MSSASETGLDAATVRQRLDVVRDRISAAGGEPSAVTVVGVTKTFPLDVVHVALAAGLGDLGESYAQELATKASELRLLDEGRLRWHFIGGLQRNKVKRVAHLVSLWQSVDRFEVGAEIARRAPGAAVLVQVNTTGEATKAGCRPGLAPGLVEGLADLGLEVRGLMTVGPTDASIDPRPGFAALRSQVDQLGLEVCSMGMSGDLDAAVAEGSTMVRVGTALFGARPGSGTPDSSVS